MSAALAAKQTPKPDEGERVLVVDDEEDLRNLVAFNVRSAGFVVEAAASGIAGLAAARAMKPAVVVLDLRVGERSSRAPI